MPIAGLTRLRFNQVAEQTVIGTAVAPPRRVPWRGIPTYNPNRTDPDVDVGSIDPVISPYPTAVDVDWNPTGPITFDDLPIRLSAGLLGGIGPTGGGGARAWGYPGAPPTPPHFF